MAYISHPDTGERIEVRIVQQESHYQFDAVQVEAVDDDVSLSDASGELPWMEADEVEN